ncbi:MAG: T9SS type A sorting domain-containing protein [Bacteroidia bacterium]|nr:T9SS type A sorting domain-containing protein [Bacteroidia bacterium]
MRRVVILYILVLTFFSGEAQIWRQFQNGIETSPTAITTSDQLIATSHIVASKAGTRTYKINIWNGYYWQSLPLIETDSTGLIYSLQFYNKALYIAGKFSEANGLDSSKNIIRWSNRKYESVPQLWRKLNDFSRIDGMTVYGNTLLLHGPFVSTSSVNNGDNIVAFSGNAVAALPVNFGKGIDGNIYDINSDQEDFLVIGGRFTKVDGSVAKQIAYFTNNQWTRITNNSIIPSKLAVHKSDIFFYGNELGKSQRGFYRVDGTGIDTLSKGLQEVSKIYDIVIIDGTLYACGLFTLNDKLDDQHLIKFENEEWVPVQNGNLSGITKLVNFKNTLVSTGAFTYNSIFNLNHIAQYIENAGIASGSVFFDKDKNCIFNNRDEQLSSMMVRVSPGNLIIKPNDNGKFFTVLENGNYTFKIIPNKYWKASANCNDGEIDAVISKGEVNDSIHFAMLLEFGKPDLSIKLTSATGWTARNKKVNQYQISYSNVGSEDITETQVVLKLDGNLKNIQAKPAPSQITSDSIIWQVKELYVGESRQIQCEIEVDADDATKEVNLEASIPLQEGEEEGEDNTSGLQQILNDEDFEFRKQVFPNIGGDTAIIQETEDKIQYQISFSNYTTDTIRNVYVIDTIGLNHSMTYIKEIGASHNFSTQVYPGLPGTDIGIIIYTFNNINLPPNPTKNPEMIAASGYITFEIGLQSGLTEGTMLSNKAHVSFDYFNPEQTNWVYALVEEESVGIKHIEEKQLKLFPNPTHTLLNFELPKIKNALYRITAVSGEEVSNGTLEQNTLNVASYSSGIYFIEVIAEDVAYRAKFIKY